MRAGRHLWKLDQSTLVKYDMIYPMNAKGLFYGKMHLRKGLFKTKPNGNRTNIPMYIN